MTFVRQCSTMDLVIEKDRAEHIAKHNIKIKEVLEAIAGDYLVLTGKSDKSLLVGKTRRGRFITVIVGKRYGKIDMVLLLQDMSRKKKKFHIGNNLKE